jgi:putative membrane protein
MTNSFILRVGLASALMCAATGGWAQGKTDKAAQTFMTKAIQGNLAEVSMGQLALKQAESQEVRSYGQQLVTDHSAANKRATTVASQMGMTPPSEPSKKQQSDAAKMAKMSGAAFDRAFVQHMVADHRKEIAEHRKAAKMKNDMAASYATEALPALEKHLEMAQALNKGMGKGGKQPSKQPSM